MSLSIILGGGGDISDYFEKAVISLAQVGGDNEDIIGATINVVDNDRVSVINTYTWQGSPITCTIIPSTNYSIQLGNIEGYFTSPSKSYISEWNTRREITCYYNADLGIYIEAVDGTIYNSLNWDSNKNPNSILILTESLKFRMSLESTAKAIHSANDASLYNYLPAKNYGDSGYDLTIPTDANGIYNTQQILQFNKDKNSNTNDYVVPYCVNYTFPNGEKNGYFPAIKQVLTIMLNRGEVNNCLTSIDKPLIGTVLESSTPGPNLQGVGHMYHAQYNATNGVSYTRFYYWSGFDAVYEFRVISDFNI